MIFAVGLSYMAFIMLSRFPLCVCGLLSTGCRIVVPLASGVCPLVGEVGLEAYVIIPLIRGLTGIVVTRTCPGY